MSGSEAEQAWGNEFRASAVPDLVAALAGCETQEILDLLGQPRYASFESKELERIVAEAERIPQLLRQRYEDAESAELRHMMREADTDLLHTLWSWPV